MSESSDDWPIGCQFNEELNIKEEPEAEFCLFLNAKSLAKDAEVKDKKVEQEKIATKEFSIRVKKLIVDLKFFSTVYCCKKCPVFYSSFANLKLHTRRQHTVRRHPCEFCEGAFLCPDSLRNHRDYFHQSKYDKKYKCDLCLRSFGIKQNLERHLNSKHKMLLKKPEDEHQQKIFPCSLCAKVFQRSKGLRRHFDLHHQSSDKGRKYKCSSCPRTFFAKVNMQQHIQSIHSNKSRGVRKETEKPGSDGKFTCNICGSKFSIHLNLSYHREYMHTTEVDLTGTYLCEFCPSSFRLKQNLIRHLKTQHNQRAETSEEKQKREKVYTCETCGSNFPERNAFNCHMEIVHGVVDKTRQNYLCEFCARSFSTTNILRLHLKAEHRITDGAKRVSCKVCDKSFSCKSRLNEHADFYHQPSKGRQLSYQCLACEKSFDFSKNLQRHSMIAHKQKREKLVGETNFKCEFCGKSLPLKNSLTRHKDMMHQFDLEKVEKYRCDICPRSFKLRENIHRHIRQHLNVSSVPRAILTKIKQEEFEVEVDEDGRFKCNECERAYSTKFSLKNHKEFVHQVEEGGAAKKYQCKSCPRSFSLKKNWMRHASSHVKKIPRRAPGDFFCLLCNAAYRQISNLYQHEDFVHQLTPKETHRYHCSNCPSSFYFLTSLNMHIRKCELAKEQTSESEKNIRRRSQRMISTTYKKIEIYDSDQD